MHGSNTAAIDVDVPIDVDVDTATAPVPGTPAPSPDRSYCHSPPKPEDSDSNGHFRPTAGRVNQRRIRGIPPWPVDNYRIVARHINNLGIYRYNFDHLTFNNHLLLFGSLEIARSLGLLPQSLNGVHDTGLLSQESFTQSLCPGCLLSHHVEDLRKRRERLHAQVPVHFVQGVVECVSLEVRVCLQPAVRFHNLVWIRRRYEDLCEKRIRIERNRRKHLVQLSLAECLAGVHLLRKGSERDHHHNDEPYQRALKKCISFHVFSSMML